MRTRNRLLGVLALSLVTGMTGVSSAASIIAKECRLEMPRFSREFADRDVVIKRIVVDASCAGVGSVEGVPDGWFASIAPRGEDTRVEIHGPERSLDFSETKAQALALAKALEELRVGLIFRGQWSDCANVHLFVEAEHRGEGGAMSSESAPVVGLACNGEEFFERWHCEPALGKVM